MPVLERQRKRTATAACALVALAWLLGCAGERGERQGALVVGAAASVAFALQELVSAYEEESGTRVDVTTGASGQLAHQIREGAPIDVFLSADREWVDRLDAEELIVSSSIAVYARGTLVVLQRSDAADTIERIEDLVREASVRIAIANPESAPYGRAARQALERAGLWAVLEPRIVIAENVRQTVQYVETSGVNAALTAGSLMRPGTGRWWPVPQDLYAPLDHALGVVAGSANPAQARAFAAFVLSESGRAILARHGLAPAPVS